MHRVALLVPFLALSLFSGITAKGQTKVLVHLSDVKTVYVDDNAFKIVSSPCSQVTGTLTLTCPKDIAKRIDFLVALKRWLGKSGFTVVDNKDDAEGVLDGTLAISDDYGSWRDTFPRPGRRHDRDDNDQKRDGSHHSTRIHHVDTYEQRWEVKAWLVNQKNRRIWTLGYDYPDISYSGKQPKIEGKRLAKAVLYDFKHHR